MPSAPNRRRYLDPVRRLRAEADERRRLAERLAAEADGLDDAAATLEADGRDIDAGPHGEDRTMDDEQDEGDKA